ncbi:histone H1 [Adhaeribacter radiodurans]|uniref:Histone H1 n=1 Tax=Adhaeribacter radiodurans TaxID=2745197 RepID=A0A7L7L6F2_9BACT|nr:histone H1 [Adhaeribacter radiodurans]
MNKFSSVKDLVMSLESDFEKFYEKGNSAAGTRVRKGMQDLKNLAQDLRKEVQDMKNNAAGGSEENAGAKKSTSKAKK